MSAYIWFSAGLIAGVALTRRFARHQQTPLAPDSGMYAQAIGDAKASGYALGDSHGFKRGLAEGVRQEREDAEWRRAAIENVIAPKRQP